MWSHYGDPLGFQVCLGVRTNMNHSPKQNGSPRAVGGGKGRYLNPASLLENTLRLIASSSPYWICSRATSCFVLRLCSE